MFGKLKDKLKSWTKNITKNAEESEVEEEIVEPVAPKGVPRDISKEKSTRGKKLPTPPKEDKEIHTQEETKTITEIIEDDEIHEQEEKKPISEIITPEETTPTPTPKKKSIFGKLISKKVTITEKDFDVYADELEMLLLENNVALEVSEKIIKRLREEIVGKELLKKEIEGEIQDLFKEIINEILIEPFDLIEKIKNREDKSKPYVVLFCGINGTGKTTSIAKIAQQLKDNKLTCVLAAGDTFRAASIEQLKTHGEKLNVPVIAHEYESDPAAVGFDAIKYAEKNKLDAVLIDTAGRMYTEKNLMSQIAKIAKVTKPDTKIFVGESITGNDIVEQVKSFDWAIQIDGIILSKADIDEKGGTALSVGYVTKKPILYLGTGQEYDKIEPFDKKKFIEKLGLDDDQ
jgi:fused signal recognition particle receptor